MLTPVPTKRPKRPTAAGQPHILQRDAPTEDFPTTDAITARDLADVLRRTTLRAHSAIKDAPPDPETLRAVRAEVDGLEVEINRLGLGRLRPFIDSLRRRLGP